MFKRIFKKNKPKVFGIGLPKTGTTSLTEALEILGYNATHYPSGDALEAADKYDAVTDSPAAIRFKELDVHFPGSKFILTQRRDEDWLKSIKKHMQRLETPKNGTKAYDLRVKSLGSASYNRKKHLKAYKNHERDVKEYFKNRPEDLLVINFIDKSQGWTEICKFLNLRVPKTEFPLANKDSKNSLQEQIKRKSS